MPNAVTDVHVSRRVRDAVIDDLPSILAIHNDAVLRSTAVWTDSPSTLEERRAWLVEKHRRGFPVVVVAEAAEVIAYASYGEFRAWPGYVRTVEHSIYVRSDRHRRGLGRMLMDELIHRAQAAAIHVMVAGIEADNEASIALHKAMGFRQVAHMSEVGRKFDRWLDLIFMQRKLG